MKKAFRLGALLIVILLVGTLVTLRFTGLEPQNLDARELAAHNNIARPGLWLTGDVVTTPVTDWSFISSLRETTGRSTIMVETRTPYVVPHSVTIGVRAKGGQLYIHSSQTRLDVPFPNDKRWTANVARDPRIRLKIGDKLYDMTAVLITDRAEAAAVLGRNSENREKGPDGQERVKSYMHVYRVFQRNITEHGDGAVPAN